MVDNFGLAVNRKVQEASWMAAAIFSTAQAAGVVLPGSDWLHALAH